MPDPEVVAFLTKRPRLAGVVVRGGRAAILQSQANLAKASGVGVMTVRRVERGEAIGADKLYALLKMLEGFDVRVVQGRDGTFSLVLSRAFVEEVST